MAVLGMTGDCPVTSLAFASHWHPAAVWVRPAVAGACSPALGDPLTVGQSPCFIFILGWTRVTFFYIFAKSLHSLCFRLSVFLTTVPSGCGW